MFFIWYLIQGVVSYLLFKLGFFLLKKWDMETKNPYSSLEPDWDEWTPGHKKIAAILVFIPFVNVFTSIVWALRPVFIKLTRVANKLF